MKCLCIFKIAGEGLLSACVAPNGNLKYLHKNAEQIVSLHIYGCAVLRGPRTGQ